MVAPAVAVLNKSFGIALIRAIRYLKPTFYHIDKPFPLTLFAVNWEVQKHRILIYFRVCFTLASRTNDPMFLFHLAPHLNQFMSLMLKLLSTKTSFLSLRK